MPEQDTRKEWLLVPKNPTPEMSQAVLEETRFCNPVGIYQKMLAAAPQIKAHPAITHCDNCGCDWLDNGLNPIGCPYCKQLEQETKITALQEDVTEWRRVAAAQAELHGEAEDRANKLAEALKTCLEVEERPSIIEMAQDALRVHDRGEVDALREALKELITWIPSADTYRRLGFDPEAPMRALGEARDAALEEAAQVCEAYERKILQSRRDNRAHHFMGASVGASACADRIRALKSACAAPAAPDVSALVEALELARRTLAMAAIEGEVTRRIDSALAPTASRRPAMTTNKPEVVAYRYTASRSFGKRNQKWHYQESFPHASNREVAEIGRMEELIRLSDYEALQAECEKLREFVERAKTLLEDPIAVFVNMKAGVIAKPSLRDLIDLHGDVPNGEDVQLLEIARLRSECEKLRKDAERYRWLRDRDQLSGQEFSAINEWLWADADFGDISAAIDTAMQDRKQGGE